jgi:hypothetical protein
MKSEDTSVTAVDKTLFTLLVVWILTTILVVTAGPLKLSRALTTVHLQLCGIILLPLAFGLTVSRLKPSLWSNLKQLVLLVILLGPCGLLILFTQWNRTPIILFWVAQTIALVFAFWQLVDFLERQSIVAAVLTSSIVIWSISTSFIWLGTELFNFAEPAVRSARALLVLLDIRYISAAVFLLVGCVAAIARAARHQVPQIPDLPRIQLSRPDVGMHVLLRALGVPIVITANLLFLILCFVINVAWHLLATTTIYLLRFGAELGLLLRDAVLRKAVVLVVIKTTVSLLLATVMFDLLISTSETEGTYLRSLLWADGIQPLLRIGAVALGLMFGTILTLRMWLPHPMRRIWVEHGVVVAHLSVAAFIAGMCAVVLARVRWLDLEPFRIPGPFSGVFGLVVVIGLLFWLVRNGVIVDPQ